MPAVLMLAGSLGLNYILHKLGRPTICSTGRRFIGPWLFLAGWGGLTAWIAPHYCRPFFRAVAAAVESFDESRPTFDLPEEN